MIRWLAAIAVGLLLGAAAPKGLAPAPIEATGQTPKPTLQAFGPVTLSGWFAQGGLVTGKAPAGSRVMLNGQPVKVATDGQFLLGFGREAPSPAALRVDPPSGAPVLANLEIAARRYVIQRVDGLPPRTVTLSPEDQARRKVEIAKLTQAREIVSDQMAWTGPFRWPASGRISGIYGSQRIRNGVPGSPHNGVDVAAPAGTPFVAPAAGRVVLAEPDYLLEGGLLILDHGHGLFSDFQHLARIDVKVGDTVAAGQRLGAIGTTGRSTGPHLHWGLKWFDARLDPQLLVNPR
jgi:murein DD-endopeptidase MepM/ murein hydrolase activator NlpD